MQFGQGFRKREAQSGSRLVAVHRTIDLPERRQGKVDVGRGHTDAGIRDGNLQTSRSFARRDGDNAVLRRELDRIADQIEQYLRDFAFVDFDCLTEVGGIVYQGDILHTGPLMHHADTFLQDVRDFHLFVSQFETSCLELREIENIVDHTEQMRAAVPNIICIFAVSGIAQRTEYFLQHYLEKPDHGVEWRSKLVAYVCEKFRFREVGFDRGFLRPAQRPFDAFGFRLIVERSGYSFDPAR